MDLEDSPYRPFSRLVPIRLLGAVVEVPENNVLLRCFQYLAPDLPYGPWCWNGECGSDEIVYRMAGGEPTRSGLSCQIPVREGMEITEISAHLRRFLMPVVSAAGKATVGSPDG